MPSDLDPVPFPGGAEGALEFAAFEKGLLDHGGAWAAGQTPACASERGGDGRERPALISEPHRALVRWGWMLAGAGMALAAAVALLLL